MRDAICLASGGLDSSVCLRLMQNQGLSPLPLFINYGQLNYSRELASLRHNCTSLGIQSPMELNLSDFGRTLSTGLTDATKDVVADAFTPCRNLLFIVSAAAIGYKYGIDKIVLGLLSEKSAIFPDQSDDFIRDAESAVASALGVRFTIILPLRDFVKAEVLKLAQQLGVTDYYSCHAGTEIPCGKCIACSEYGE
ncbi:7-cyano-7-deazaguanine synthase [Neorhizobium sp. DAR64860/K0K1]|uniref:7-cyano-7-deazaguanine synthase n=1 Tax=Neorhizobium sp. DAR64860/K0K1 TaxID=3421955 RepID=UPI003D29845E